MGDPLRVGFIGAGLATQAIHIPTLAALGPRFRITRIAGGDAVKAAKIAARCGASPANAAQDVCAATDVDVVAICSPDALHAEHAVAACRAGKKLVLIEKPLAASREQARRIVSVARETGTRLVVGAMHVYDPAFREAHAAFVAGGERPVHVHSTICLRDNGYFVDQASQPAPPPLGPRRIWRAMKAPVRRWARSRRVASIVDDRAAQVARLPAAIRGLAIHDLPLIRALVPDIGDVLSARFVPEFGYEISYCSAQSSARLLAFLPGVWTPRWSLRAFSPSCELHATFPPSFVLSGSAECELRSRDGVTAFRQNVSGYEAMWSHVHAVATREARPAVGIEDILGDFDYAIELADRVDAFLRHDEV